MITLMQRQDPQEPSRLSIHIESSSQFDGQNIAQNGYLSSILIHNQQEKSQSLESGKNHQHASYILGKFQNNLSNEVYSNSQSSLDSIFNQPKIDRYQQIYLSNDQVVSRIKPKNQNDMLCSLSDDYGSRSKLNLSKDLLSESEVCKQELIKKQLYSLVQRVSCLITFYWFDQKQTLSASTQGSAFLIDQQHIITARHNLYLNGSASKSQRCIVQIRDHNNIACRVDGLPSSEWLQNVELDLAMIPLSKRLTNFNNFIPLCEKAQIEALSHKSTIYLAGYSFLYRNKKPTPMNSQDRMHVLKVNYEKIFDDNMDYKARTVSGLSGSPIILETSENKLYIIGLHLSRRPDPSIECRGLVFDAKATQQIKYWRQNTQTNCRLIDLQIEMISNRFQKYMQFLKRVVSKLWQGPTKEQLLDFYEMILMGDPTKQQNYRWVTRRLMDILNKDELERFYQRIGKKLDISQQLLNQERNYFTCHNEYSVQLCSKEQNKEVIKKIQPPFDELVLKNKVKEDLMEQNQAYQARMQCKWVQESIKFMSQADLMDNELFKISNCSAQNQQQIKLAASYKPPLQLSQVKKSHSLNPEQIVGMFQQSKIRSPNKHSNHQTQKLQLVLNRRWLQPGDHANGVPFEPEQGIFI